MDTHDQVQNDPLKDENVTTNVRDQPKNEDIPPSHSPAQETTVSSDQPIDNEKTTSTKDNSSQDASDTDIKVIDTQPDKVEDIAPSNDLLQDAAVSTDQTEHSDETIPKEIGSSQDASDVDIKVTDSQHKNEKGIVSSDDQTQDTAVPIDQIEGNNEITPNEIGSSQDVSDDNTKITDSQPKKEENIEFSDGRMQDKPVPVNQIEDNNENSSPKEADSFQNASELIEVEPQTEDSDIAISDELNKPIASVELPSNDMENQITRPTDGVGNNVTEDNIMIPSTEINGSPLIHDKTNDRSAVTIENDIIPPKTNGIVQPSSSKVKNYCLENWLLVLAICLIILTIIATIIIAAIIVPILKRQIVRPVRLPGNVIPKHYVLEIHPYLIPDHFEFQGSVVITILCVNSTNKLILHSRDLDIDEKRIGLVNLDGDRSPFIIKTEYDLENEFVIFRLCENLQEGTKYDIHLVFKGKFAENLKGFSMDKYEKNDEIRHIAFTKFETIYARKAFPCFDEPALKATFDINLIRWKNMTSLSNMKRLTTVERDENWEIDMYQTSVPMSTYLVAFVVGDLEKIQKGKVSIWATKDVDYYQLALNFTVALLEFYESYLEVPYGLPKLDQLAADSYASSGMENWGLIIYRYRMIRPGESEDKQIARIISHELAHQWFGNLVTMKWWNELWLNEGFAAYFGYYGANIINQEWKMMDEGLIRYIDNFMNYECYDPNVVISPIINHVESTDDIKASSRRIIYLKGAALVRMMHMLLGDDVFRRGLKSYLEENAFESVGQDDLWMHLTRVQPREKRLDIKKIMEPWTKQSHYPLITVTRRYKEHEAVIEQMSCTNVLNIESKDMWPVPITWIDGSRPNYRNTTIKLILDSEKGILRGLPGKETWLLVNVEQLGYFRVNYDENNWELLLWQLRHNFKVIPTVNRKLLLSDALFFAKNNKLSDAVALDILTYYPFEKEKIVLNALFYNNHIYYYRNMIKHTDAESYWKEFVHYLFKPIFIRHAGILEEEAINFGDIDFRWQSVRILCYEGYTPCLSILRAKFKDLLEGKGLPKFYNPISFEMLLCALTRNSTKEEWNNMKRVFQDSSFKHSTSFLLCTENYQLFQRQITEYIFTDEGIPNFFLLTDGDGRGILCLSENWWKDIIEYLRKHWKEIKRKRYREILLFMASQPHNKMTFDMITEFYEIHQSDLSTVEKEVIDRWLSETFRLIPTPDRVRNVIAWLKSRSWEKIDIREIDQ